MHGGSLLRKSALLAVLLGLFLTTAAYAQQGDATIGFGTTLSSGSNSCTFVSCTAPEKGGTYISVGADAIFHKREGIAFDATWKASQGDFAGTGIPYRPILIDFNGVYQPRLSKKVGFDLVAGIGWQDTRLYSSNYTCSYFSCTNYTSANHFLVDVGAGVRYYAWGNFFVRPEVRFYHIVGNTDNLLPNSGGFLGYSSNNVVRVGASIGYTIGGPQ